MTDLLHNLLICTVNGSIMFLLGAALNLVVGKRSMSRWYYMVIVMSLIMMVLPLEKIIALPKLFKVSLPESIAAETGGIVPAVSGASYASPQISVIGIIFFIWLGVTLALAIRNVILYFKASRTINKMSCPCTDKVALNICRDMAKRLGIGKRVNVMVEKDVSSPFLFGIFKTKIIIPDRRFTDEELKMVFAHELTHLKHHDLHIKLLGVAVGCLHWFNPLVHIIRRSLNTACEWCCDEAVLRTLKLNDQKDYGRLIISVIEGSSIGIAPYSTSMASAKKNIKRRLSKIAGFREVTRLLRTAGIMLAACLSVCSLTVFGFAQAATILPEEIAPIFESSTPKTVTSRFSAKPLPTQTPSEPTPTPLIETVEEYEAVSANEPVTLEAAEPQTVPEYENRGDYTYAYAEHEEAYPTDAPTYEAEPTSTPIELVLRDALVEPEKPTPPTETEALISATVKIPSSSAYVLDINYGENGLGFSPVLEAVSSGSIRIKPISTLSEIYIYRCDKVGNIGECIYSRSRDIHYNINMAVSQGEYYIITIKDSDPQATASKMIIE